MTTQHGMLYQTLHAAVANPTTAAQRLFSLDPATISVSLIQLVAALPRYHDITCLNFFRSIMITLIEQAIPATPIAMRKATNSRIGVRYVHMGSFATYREAFCGGNYVADTPMLQTMRRSMFRRGPGIALIFTDYAIALLTDAIRLYVPHLRDRIDKVELRKDLHQYHHEFVKAIPVCYQLFIHHIYGPTTSAITYLEWAGQTASARNALKLAILDDDFVNAVEEAMRTSDGVAQVEWLLFNLWILLKALGERDIDGHIQFFQECGLQVPARLGPAVWEKIYTKWFPALNGADLTPRASTTIMATMLVKRIMHFYKIATVAYIPYTHGYAQSFIEWSDYNRYLQSQSSHLDTYTGIPASLSHQRF